MKIKPLNFKPGYCLVAEGVNGTYRVWGKTLWSSPYAVPGEEPNYAPDAIALRPVAAVKYCVGADNTIENRIDCTRSVYGNLP